jgi:anti-anti-sigma regulatory factor
MSAYQYLSVECHNDVACVRFVRTRLEETETLGLGDELFRLAHSHPKMVLVLGPQRLDLLFSVFLAKLIRVRNEARRLGGDLVLCEASPITWSVFSASLLDRQFVYRPTLAEALAYWRDQAAATGS